MHRNVTECRSFLVANRRRSVGTSECKQLNLGGQLASPFAPGDQDARWIAAKLTIARFDIAEVRKMAGPPAMMVYGQTPTPDATCYSVKRDLFIASPSPQGAEEATLL